MSEERRRNQWRLVSTIVTAHVGALQEEGAIDEQALDALAVTIDSVSTGDPPDGSLFDLIAAFDDRLDSLCPPRVVGVARLGRGSIEVANAVTRMTIRDAIADLAGHVNDLVATLIDVAGAHVVTMLPAYAGSQPVQPTTVANMLGGVIGPLGRATDRLERALETVNRSPMGSGAVASFRFAPDRQEMAEALGFIAPIPSAFDAVSSVDFLEETASAVEALTNPVTTLLREIESLVRAIPEAIVFDDRQLARLPDIPQVRYPMIIDLLNETAGNVQAGAGAVRRWVAHAGFGPQLRIDHPLEWLLDAFVEAGNLFDQARTLLTDGLEFNRAVLGNRAGKGFITSSDLVDFLILEEEIAPGDARIIAARVLGQIKERGLEIAGITKEIVDAAGLMVIGREIGIEFEALSKYLAPRRFLENRTATGSPAPDSTRKWLRSEAASLALRRSRFETLQRQWTITQESTVLEYETTS